jgi:hypothetical protein
MCSESRVAPMREIIKNMVIGMEDLVIRIGKEISVFKEAE